MHRLKWSCIVCFDWSCTVINSNQFWYKIFLYNFRYGIVFQFLYFLSHGFNSLVIHNGSVGLPRHLSGVKQFSGVQIDINHFVSINFQFCKASFQYTRIDGIDTTLKIDIPYMFITWKLSTYVLYSLIILSSELIINQYTFYIFVMYMRPLWYRYNSMIVILFLA